MDRLCIFVSSVSCAFASDHYCLEVTCWERADLLALVGDVYCFIVTSPCGILGQLRYLIVSFAVFLIFYNQACRLFHGIHAISHSLQNA